jgi:hypothetical protein
VMPVNSSIPASHARVCKPGKSTLNASNQNHNRAFFAATGASQLDAPLD